MFLASFEALFLDFYPRSPRGERRSARAGQGAAGRFLSTLPARGATTTLRRFSALLPISIHAPREGSDIETASRGLSLTDFYPRSPRGERPRLVLLPYSPQ